MTAATVAMYERLLQNLLLSSSAAEDRGVHFGRAVYTLRLVHGRMRAGPPEPGTNRLVVFPERWWWQVVTRGSRRERDRITNHVDGTFSSADLDNRLETELGRQAKSAIDGVDRSAWQSRRAQ